VQTSFITRYSSLNFSPDPNLGDLLFNGISQQAYKRDVAYGLQSDGAYKLSDSHTLRAGVYAQTDRLTSNTTSHVLRPMPPVLRPAMCPSASSTTAAIPNGSRASICRTSGHVAPVLVVNYGVRFDHYTAFSSGSQLSPRANLVWQAAPDTTVHAGYSRFFSPPPFELVGGTTVAKFLNTTAAPALTQDDRLRPSARTTTTSASSRRFPVP